MISPGGQPLFVSIHACTSSSLASKIQVHFYLIWRTVLNRLHWRKGKTFQLSASFIVFVRTFWRHNLGSHAEHPNYLYFLALCSPTLQRSHCRTFKWPLKTVNAMIVKSFLFVWCFLNLILIYSLLVAWKDEPHIPFGKFKVHSVH